MSKVAWVPEGKAVVYCMECDWKSDLLTAHHDCARHPDNLEKEIARLHRFTRYTLRMLERMTQEQFSKGRDKGIRTRARKLLGIGD